MSLIKTRKLKILKKINFLSLLKYLYHSKLSSQKAIPSSRILKENTSWQFSHAFSSDDDFLRRGNLRPNFVEEELEELETLAFLAGEGNDFDGGTRFDRCAGGVSGTLSASRSTN